MSRPSTLKEFEEQLNELKVDDDGFTPMEKFAGNKSEINLLSKITIHGAVQFVSWMQDYKATYLALSSGKISHMQGSTFVTHHFMQGQ